ncbi:hypothetical protein TrST_g9157 [Triparma strigata]|uniref:Threonine dehydratase n=1 Tax=Triparma strigata TaxID=1606541 RepID=A0A9W7F383_9STRA|nr:hypothetical protein TrST_g9157 [Triparma strigata]
MNMMSNIIMSSRRSLCSPSIAPRCFSSTSGSSSGPVGLADDTLVERASYMDSTSPPLLLDPSRHAVGYLSRILNARVYDVTTETPLQPAPTLSKSVKNTVHLKREDTHSVFSFKIRGAYNKMSSLSSDKLERGVVACSAGNHAQGVALSSSSLSCPSTIVMPLATPQIKVNAVSYHGGSDCTVVLHGQNYDEASEEAKRLEKEEGLTMIHPFDDPSVIAGQGTIGMEILKQSVSEKIDGIFVCCGGGGMLAGIAAYVKRVRPEIKVIGCEAEDAAGMTESLRQGRVVTLEKVGLFADGAAVRTVGEETFRVCNMLVDDMVTVSTDQICSAIKLTYNDARVVLEPAGALAVAGMKKYVERHGIEGKNFVCITSGANMDFDRMRFVSERADDSEKMIRVRIPERSGAFRALYNLIWPRNVTEFSYRYDSSKNSQATVLMSFQPVPNIDTDFDDVMQELESQEYEAKDLSTNELAKVHARYMAGGRNDIKVEEERLFRFEFPEAPGALKRFLNALEVSWNISLFHYRNHGDDFGRVLVGIQIPSTDDDEEKLKKFLGVLGGAGYKYTEETDNECYQDFLL